ncbi:patched domain-containing protein 3 [Genypterus blacodes]|uniref:patched domain-containing protein 3 n=1 Tax=Genypterus blacodes TaxID=154954 RepID=UPI003F774032
MVSCQTDCIVKPLCFFFEKMGRFIGNYPWWFLIIPLIISAGLGSGFYFLNDRMANSIQEQFTPINGPAKAERKYFEETFPGNASMFSNIRMTTDGNYGTFIATEIPDILTVESVQAILDLNRKIWDMEVKLDDKSFKYADICAIVNKTCFTNAILDIIDYNATLTDKVNLTYPWYPVNIPIYFFLGSVTLEKDSSKVASAEALQLHYYLQENDETKQKTDLWMESFIDLMSKEPLPSMPVSFSTSMSMQLEFEKSPGAVISLFSITYTVAITFSIISCWRLDNVQNKVWVANCGVFCTGLSILAGFGSLLFLGQPFVMTVASCPFMILGIGLDDMFIMISCWERSANTSEKCSSAKGEEGEGPFSIPSAKSVKHKSRNRIQNNTGESSNSSKFQNNFSQHSSIQGKVGQPSNVGRPCSISRETSFKKEMPRTRIQSNDQDNIQENSGNHGMVGQPSNIKGKFSIPKATCQINGRTLNSSFQSQGTYPTSQTSFHGNIQESIPEQVSYIEDDTGESSDIKSKVSLRLGRTYKEAAVSITITSLTDALALFLGYLSQFGSVQSFCLYAGVCVVFCYLLNITVLGAFMALNGRREEANKHWFTCAKVSGNQTSKASKTSASGTEEVHPMSRFFEKYYGPFLTNPWVKACVMVLYVGYLAASIYGCTNLKEGLDTSNLALDDSYLINYYDDQKEHFSEYSLNAMVAVKEKFPYWNEIDKLKLCIADFERLTYVTNNTIAWFLSYQEYAHGNKQDISTEVFFLEHLPQFLNDVPMFRQDINMSENTIMASRFFIQTLNNVSTKDMLLGLRKTADECSIPLLVYHPAFIYFDQYTVIAARTIETMILATGAMLVVSLLLIPNPICSLWVAFAIASVIVGVTGFMVMWDVSLDSISMINLIMCIGFSVDFSAHMSYAFVSSEKETANDKAKDALAHLGYPVLQGAVSTILGVVVLASSASYIFRTFFKIMFLVIAFGLVHGIVFIPVFLMLFGSCNLGCKSC